MITLDSSAVIALIGPNDSKHAQAVAALEKKDEERIIPAAALGEIGYFVEQRHGQRVLLSFIGDLIADAFIVQPDEPSFDRIFDLVERYQDMPLGLVDAAVIACAERNGGRVHTYDYRHFGVVAGEGTITLVQ